MLKVMFWTKKGPAYIIAARVLKAFRRSTRYETPNGLTFTIKHKDLISVEEV